MKRVGYWVDMLGVQLSDLGLTWMQAVPIGKYSHPVYGDLNFTPDMIKQMADNVNNRVRGIDLAIDYDHKSDDKAAGWIKQAEVRNDGLWVGVEWTASALAALKAKEYRYFSPEIADEWTDAQNVTYHDVLFGGGLTNRPYLKDLLPINLSEVFAKQKEGVTRVDPKLLELLRKKFKLAEDAPEADVLKALEDDTKVVDPPVEDKTPPATTLSEAELTKMFGEQAPFVKQMMTTIEGQNKVLTEAAKKIAGLEASTKLAEVNLEVQQLTEGGKFALPPVALDLFKKIRLGEEAPEKFGEVLAAIKKNGLIELGERGGRRPTEEKNAGQSFTEAVTKMLSDNKDLDYADAVELVAREDPELFEDYRMESFGTPLDQQKGRR